MAINSQMAREGVKAGSAYVVKCSEDDWLALDASAKNSYQQKVLALAVDGGLEIACIQLVPDELFSTTGSAKPYIGWQQRTRIKKPNPYDDVNTAAQALKTLVQAGRASKVDYVYVPLELAEAVLDFCSDVRGFKE